MIGPFLRKLFPPGNAPKCMKCGHEPCPACEVWCDIIVSNIYCPKCEKVVRSLSKEDKEGQMVKCACGHEWGLKIEDDVENCDLCCDGECEWDQPEEQVIRWCARYRGWPWV